MAVFSFTYFVNDPQVVTENYLKYLPLAPKNFHCFEPLKDLTFGETIVDGELYSSMESRPRPMVQLALHIYDLSLEVAILGRELDAPDVECFDK